MASGWLKGYNLDFDHPFKLALVVDSKNIEPVKLERSSGWQQRNSKTEAWLCVPAEAEYAIVFDAEKFVRGRKDLFGSCPYLGLQLIVDGQERHPKIISPSHGRIRRAWYGAKDARSDWRRYKFSKVEYRNQIDSTRNSKTVPPSTEGCKSSQIGLRVALLTRTDRLECHERPYSANNPVGTTTALPPTGGRPSNGTKAIDGVVDFFRRPATADSRNEGDQPQLITRLGSWMYLGWAQRKVSKGSIGDTCLDQRRNLVIDEYGTRSAWRIWEKYDVIRGFDDPFHEYIITYGTQEPMCALGILKKQIPPAVEIEVVHPSRKSKDASGDTRVGNDTRPIAQGSHEATLSNAAGPIETAPIDAAAIERSLSRTSTLIPSDSDSLIVHCGPHPPSKHTLHESIKTSITPAIANDKRAPFTSNSSYTAKDLLDLANARAALKRAEYGMRLAELGVVRARIKARAVSKTSGRRDGAKE